MRFVLANVLIMMALASAAHSASEVQLRSSSGDFTISGRLLALEEETYILETSIGTLRIATTEVTCQGSACPALQKVMVYANASLGEPISLKGADLMISGILRAFRNQTYIVETKIGEMTIPAEGITCQGPGCPTEVNVPARHLPFALGSGRES